MSERTWSVLLVEDEASDVELIREALRQLSGLKLSVVADGEQALAYLRAATPFESAARPDLILLDLNLPRVDGREVLRQLKCDDALRAIPVIIMTTSSSMDDVARCYEWGANCYVTKPLSLDEFLAKVKAIHDFWFDVVRLPPRNASGHPPCA